MLTAHHQNRIDDAKADPFVFCNRIRKSGTLQDRTQPNSAQRFSLHQITESQLIQFGKRRNPIKHGLNNLTDSEKI
jgi:hypothetical protein